MLVVHDFFSPSPFSKKYLNRTPKSHHLYMWFNAAFIVSCVKPINILDFWWRFLHQWSSDELSGWIAVVLFNFQQLCLASFLSKSIIEMAVHTASFWISINICPKPYKIILGSIAQVKADFALKIAWVELRRRRKFPTALGKTLLWQLQTLNCLLTA